MGDTHIYSNHFHQVEVQLSRTPYEYPELLVNPGILGKTLEQITLDDFAIIGYMSHPPIEGEMSI